MVDKARNVVPVIYGPTAIGKTSLAIQLSQAINGEIVSCDSRQLFKHLDIGTAKPTTEERESVKFHLIDLIEPKRFLNAFEFRKLAEEAIDGILQAGRLPVMTVGTGFYLKAMTDGIVEAPSANEEIRSRLEELAESNGITALHSRLQSLDPETASLLDENDKVRIIRALELCELTGKTRRELTEENQLEASPYNFVFVGLTMDRDHLYDRINARCEQMIDDGLIDECRRLREKGRLSMDVADKIVGYREAFQYLEGIIDRDEMISRFKQSTRNYAKRQLTWFRKHPGGRVFDVEDKVLFDNALEYVEQFL